MKHVRMLGLCLVAVFAMGAIAATSASALPEFGECFKKGAGGKYTEAGCVKKASLKAPGEYEWRKETEIADKKIAGLSVGSNPTLVTTFHLCNGRNVKTCSPEEEATLGPLSVECEHELNNGEATGTKEIKNVAVIFTGCKLLGSAPCSNTTNEGEIVTNGLHGKLGFINKNTKPRQVGVLLEPAAKGGLFAQFNCLGSVETHVGGAKESEFPAYPPKGGGDGIISPIAPVNTMVGFPEGLTQTYAVNSEEENLPSKFEGAQPLKVLEDWENETAFPENRSKWSKAGESLVNIEFACANEFQNVACTEGERENESGKVKTDKPAEVKAN